MKNTESTSEMFAAWLADPKNANHPNRTLMEQEHRRMTGGASAHQAASEEERLASEVLQVAGIAQSEKQPQTLSTEADLAAQILKLAGVQSGKRV